MAFLARCPSSTCRAPKRIDKVGHAFELANPFGITRCPRCGVSYHAWFDPRLGLGLSVESWGWA